MKLTYGTYSHDVNEASIRISSSQLDNGGIEPLAKRIVWQITGHIHGTSQADLKTKILALETAYVDGKDATLLHNDGTTDSAHKLVSANAIGGIKVIAGPEYPIGDGAEYSTFRTFAVAIQGDFPLSALGTSTILDWHESVTFAGGGPRDIGIELLNAVPVFQRTQAATIYRAHQSGRAMGYKAYPIVPSPHWPFAEMRPRRVIRYGTAQVFGTGANRTSLNYPVEWSYEFESELPFTFQISSVP